MPEDDTRALWLGWMNNWQYAEDIPTSPWRSAQTVPRSVHIRAIDGSPRLVQKPVAELQALRRDHVHLDNQPVTQGSISLSTHGIVGKSIELIAVFEPEDARRVGLDVRAGDTEKTSVRFDAENSTISVDRTASGETGFHEAFPGRDEAPLSLRDGRVKLHVLVDWSSIEVFANDGARVLTHRIFPSSGSDGVSLVAEGGKAKLVRLDAWRLRSIWGDR